MKVKAGFVAVAVVLALLGFALAGAVAHGAPSHQSGCHSQHTCPSDHHTYVWTDTSTGLLWDCAEPGASEYDPSRDTTTIVYQSLTYYCRSGSAKRSPTGRATSCGSTPTPQKRRNVVRRGHDCRASAKARQPRTADMDADDLYFAVWPDGQPVLTITSNEPM
jgi:hypothetical protein